MKNPCLRNSVTLTLWILSVFYVVSNQARAETVTRQIIEDTCVLSLNPQESDRCEEVWLYAGIAAGSSGYDAISYLLPEALNIPSGNIITNATLHVFNGNNIDSSGQVSAWMVSTDWDECEFTWATQPGATTPKSPGIHVTGFSWADLDVTEIVQKWHNGSASNHGFALWCSDQNPPSCGYRGFASIQHGLNNWHPYLEVTYESVPQSACCAIDGSCELTTEFECVGDWHSEWSNCSIAECPQPTGACCYTDYTCAITTNIECSGNWVGIESTCDQCPPPFVAACCTTDGSCELTTETECAGNWHVEWSTCSVAECPQPTGACCIEASCIANLSQAVCQGSGGQWAGPLTECDLNRCCNDGDVDHDGNIDLKDFSCFQKCASSTTREECRCVDMNNNGYVGIDDLVLFIEAISGPEVPFNDCNANDIDDSIEIQHGTAADCNSNAVPDECDIEDGTSEDVNTNRIPDECELSTFTFDTDAQGWSVVSFPDFGPYSGTPMFSGSVDWEDSIGNPGGCLRWDDEWTGATFLKAPYSFVSEIMVSYGFTLQWDIRVEPTGSFSTADVILVGTETSLIMENWTPPQASTEWQTFSVQLTEQGWQFHDTTAPTENQFRSVLESLTAVYLRAEFSGGNVSYLDNVNLSDVCIPRWDTTIGNPGFDNGNSETHIRAIAQMDSGNGMMTYAGGWEVSASSPILSHIGVWDGTSWQAVGSGVNSHVRALCVFNDGTGEALYAGGDFTEAGGLSANHIARWDGIQWSPVGVGFSGSVYSLKVIDDGSGPSLYAGGNFSSLGDDTSCQHIAHWNPDLEKWEPLGGGVNGLVYTMEEYQDDSGYFLYAGGSFTSADGITVSSLARWDGSNWANVAGGTNNSGYVYSLATYDDGTGDALYVGGKFTKAGALTNVTSIVKWDGSIFEQVGDDLTSDGDITPEVMGIAPFCNGQGREVLHIAGIFSTTDGGKIARLDSNTGTWTALDGECNKMLTALFLGQESGHTTLYVGGRMTTVDGKIANHIAIWSCQ